jgi:hypothetical protein
LDEAQAGTVSDILRCFATIIWFNPCVAASAGQLPELQWKRNNGVRRMNIGNILHWHSS